MFYEFARNALIAALIATAAPSFAATPVKEVTVTVDAEALKNNKAAAHWATLSGDLTKAIVNRLPTGISEGGAKIDIDIDSVSLATTLQAATGAAESRLIGSVKINRTGGDATDRYDLTISFADAGVFFPEGTDLTKITTDSKEYYDAMVAAFADHVVAKLN